MQEKLISVTNCLKHLNFFKPPGCTSKIHNVNSHLISYRRTLPPPTCPRHANCRPMWKKPKSARTWPNKLLLNSEQSCVRKRHMTSVVTRDGINSLLNMKYPSNLVVHILNPIWFLILLNTELDQRLFSLHHSMKINVENVGI